ncbi:MAG: MarR family transcriptional regulator [Promethearchaeota archaeon]
MIVQDRYNVSSYEEKQDLFSLSPSSKFILYILKQRGPLVQKDLQDTTLLPKRTIAYALKRLQDLNFICKLKDKRDKRKSIFTSLI